MYGGPGSYFVDLEENQKFINAETDEVGKVEVTEEVLNANREVIEAGDNRGRGISTFAAANVWVQLPSERFRRYNGVAWQNSNDHCGSYAAAIALAYYQDYANSDHVPTSIRTKNSTSPGTLITKLEALIETGWGTLPGHVVGGVRKFLSNNGSSHYAQFTDFGTWDYVVHTVDRGRPIIVGLTSLAGSEYGNHWVTVYGYMENASGKGYYRCIDNWGYHAEVIQTSWSCGAVWISG